MPRKLTDSEIKNWTSRITVSKAVLERKVKRWKNVVNLYANRAIPPVEGMGSEADADMVTVNMIFSNVRIKAPSLYYANPDFMVLPEKPYPAEKIQAVDSVLRWAMRYAKMKDRMNRCVLDSLLMSMGICKQGYSARLIRNMETPPRDEATGLLEKIKGVLPKRKSPERETSVLTPPPRIAVEGPTLMRVSPMSFMTHPDARFPLNEGARWCAQIAIKTLGEIRHDERYDANWRKKLQATHFLDKTKIDLQTEAGGQVDDPDMAFVILYEIWDMMHREVLVFAEGNWDEGPGRLVDWPFDRMEGYPYTMLVPYEIPDEWEALTEEDPIAHQLEELNKIRSYQIQHLKRANRKYISSPDLSEEDLRALEIGADGLVVRATERGDVRSMLAPIQDAQVSPDVYNTQEIIKNDINTISAVAQFDRGSVAGAGTATEASIIESGNRQRADFSQLQVADFAVETLHNLLAICQQWLPEDLVLQATGDAAQPWMEITPEEIDGRFALEIIPGSLSPPNKDLMRVQALRLLELWVNNPGVDQYELNLMVARQFPEVLGHGTWDKMLKNPNIQVPDLPPSAEEALAGAAPPMGPPGGPPMMMPPAGPPGVGIPVAPLPGPGGPQPAAIPGGNGGPF